MWECADVMYRKQISVLCEPRERLDLLRPHANPSAPRRLKAAWESLATTATSPAVVSHVCMYVCMYVCMHTYIRINIPTYIHIFIGTYIYQGWNKPWRALNSSSLYTFILSLSRARCLSRSFWQELSTAAVNIHSYTLSLFFSVSLSLLLARALQQQQSTIWPIRHACAHTYMHTHLHTYIRMYLRTYPHTYLTHIHTCMYQGWSKSSRQRQSTIGPRGQRMQMLLIYSEKSPLCSEKSRIHSEESPTYSEKSPIYSDKRPMYSEKSPIYR